jgi:thioredoxin reductase (NADPH)
MGSQEMGKADYDLIIAGGGPAGLTAGLYAARAMLRTLLLEKMAPGGQAATTFHIENYPGFAEGISGPDLAQAMENQAKKFGLAVTYGEVKKMSFREPLWEVEYEDRKLLAKAVIAASGVDPRKLGIPGEETLRGRGVSYCATCDGPFFKDQEIGVVGGGDSAVEEALYLTRFATKIFLVHRRNALRAEKILQERAFQNPKIEILWDTVVTKVLGDSGVEGLELQNVKTKNLRTLKVGGVFFYVGWLSNTEFLKGIVNLDEQGFVVTDDQMATSAPGVFAAGDVRKKLLRQVATAVGDGAMAAFAAGQYVESRRWP